MSVRVGFGLAALLTLAGSTACWAAPRVEFRDNRLKVDGRPFFIYGCWGTPNGDYAEFKGRHFNTAFMGWASAPDEGPKAAAAGLMVIPYPYAPAWSDQMKTAMESIADEDWVLAWNIGDDLNKREQVEAALKVRDEMRALDPQSRPIMFDAIGLYEEFARIPDMWCAYAYPLVKPAVAAPPGKPGGLQEYGEWLHAMRLLGREDGFFWTWAQCHVQIWYNTKFLGGTDENQWRPSRFPDGDHLRLIAAHAISAGARGLMWFVHYYFQDDHLGRDRYARAAVIGCELDVLGSLVAQGKAGERLQTSDPSVWATPIDFPGGRLICLLRTGDLFHYQPDAAGARDVRIEVDAPGRIYQIGPDIRELPTPECSFDLTSWLLVTEDDALVARLREQQRTVLPDMARFTAEELEARLAKVRATFDELGAGPDATADGERRLTQAREQLARENWTDACRAAEEGLHALRAAQHEAWSAMWTDEVLDAGLPVTDFYLLPTVAEQLRLLEADAWGPNQLANGSFESDEGWTGPKLAHDKQGEAAFVEGAGRDGSRALRLKSDSPTIYEGEPRDWVTVDVVSGKIPAEPGQLWEIAAFVRVPKALEQTTRGLTIALFAYNADGKRIPGYGAQDLEAARIDATEGWTRMRLVVPLTTPGVASVAARLALCGVGEADVDDVTVRMLRAEQE